MSDQVREPASGTSITPVLCGIYSFRVGANPGVRPRFRNSPKLVTNSMTPTF